ncbi:hypothetical protein OHB35_46010 [Streptomyces phaeochromogenes]|uniref:Uncharacterized protein n=1 Tax=Streptomyces phaeochromogenes TaxID=1923 RepID=A0ABZ1HPR6_STRPH|nr:hypothetical protein [Streptomyces phaeochromogenes]WSD20004.1 hypothetical protein OHB35_46010 [Streptomyces phaeochromogenes]
MTTTDPTTPPAASVRRTDKLLALLSPRSRRPVPHAAKASADHSPGGGPDSGPDVWLAGLRLGS